MQIKLGIVEDDAEIRSGFQKLLANSENFSAIITYDNAEDFMKNYINEQFDVVLMDIQLPGISGIECIKSIYDKNLKPQFLICSVYEDDDNIFNALCAGAVGYILKNSSPEKLLEGIIEVYQGGSPMSGEIARKVIKTFRNDNNPAPTSSHLSLLTAREKEILDLLSKGYRYKEIADLLFISIKTVRPHIRNIYEKLQVSSRMDAVNKVYGKR